MRSTWDVDFCVDLFGSNCGSLAMIRSEKRELRKRIQEFFKQNERCLGRAQQFTPSDHKPDNLVSINIGTDEKPKYVWRVCK
jgi:hypothetical protein